MTKRKTPAPLETKAAKKGQEIAPAPTSSLPAYLQGNERGTGLRSMTADDLRLPRIKLLQSVSPELEKFPDASAKMFWHSVLDQQIGGDEFDFVVCADKRRYLLLPPRHTQMGVLARADDAVHWTPGEGEWDINIEKGSKRTAKWKLAPTVKESGLHKFGSSDPSNPDSPPAATLFYDYLAYLPDHPELSPVVISLFRSSSKRGKDLNGKLALPGSPIQSMRFTASVTKEQNSAGDVYFNWAFRRNGFATEDEFNRCCDIAERFKDFSVVNDEEFISEEGNDAPTAGEEPKGKKKF